MKHTRLFFSALLLLVFGLCFHARADDFTQEIQISNRVAKVFKDVSISDGESGKVLKVDFEKGKGRRHIFEIEDPNLTESTFVVEGEVYVEGLLEDQHGYCEMWTHLPGATGGKEIMASFFSRTLGMVGPMKRLEKADSEWRKFYLPANMMEDPRRPIKLSINVVMPKASGDEVVYFRNLKIRDDAKDIFGASPKKILKSAGFLSIFVVGGIVSGLLLAWFMYGRRKSKQKAELKKINAMDL